MRPLLVALVLCVGCHAHLEEESKAHATTASDVETDTKTHVVDAPDRTTTTTEQLDEQGRVRKRSVKVKEHGAVTTDIDAKSQGHEDTDLDEEHRSQFDFDFLHGPLTWIGALVVVGALVAAFFKFRSKLPIP